MSESVIDLYVKQINIAISCPNSEQIKQAEEQLQLMFRSDPNSMEYLVQIVCSSTIQDNTRLGASLMCKTIQQQIKSLHLTQQQEYTFEQQIKHAQSFVSCFKNDQLNTKLKCNITEALLNQLSLCKKISERSITQTFICYSDYQKILDLLFNHCTEILQAQDLISGGLYLMQALVDTYNGSLDIEKNTSQSKCLKVFLTIGTNITQKNDTVSQQNLSHWTKVCLELCQKALVQKKNNKNINPHLRKLQNFIIYNQDFCNSLLNIILFAPTGSKVIFMSQTNDQNVDVAINTSKIQSLETLNLILELFIIQRPKSEFKQGPFFHCLSQLIPTLVICLMSLLNLQTQNITETLDNEELASTLTQLMKFISLCAGITEFYSIMSEVKSSILLDVILPMLSTSTKEMKQAYDDPEEFVNLALDTVEQKTSRIAKTAAADLLETFCDHIDGSTSFITQICVLMINHSIQSIWTGKEIFTDDVSTPYFLLNDLRPRIIFQKMNAKQRIDSCLMALSIISYLLTKRQDLITLLETMLKQNLNFFSNPSLDPLLITRLCLFLGYYSDNLFQSENTSPDLILYINILISFLSYKDGQCSLVLMYQAVDSLKNICEDQNLVQKVQPLLPQLLPSLCIGLQKSKYEPHFDMIQSILKIYSKFFLQEPQLFQAILEVLVQRVIIDQQLVEQGNKHHQIWINKAWNIFRNIPETPDYLQPFFYIVVNTLAPLFRMMENPINIEFDEDIILLVSSLIAKSKRVDVSLLDLIFLCTKLLEKQKYLLGQMFEMLNNMMYYGHELFQSIEYQKKYFEIALLSINTQQFVNPYNCVESEIGEGVLLIQLGIQKLGPNLNDETLKETFQYVLTLSSQNLKTDILKSRLMGVFLSAFLFNFQKSCAILQELNLLQQVFDNLINNYQLIQAGYDTKLYIISLVHCFQGSLNMFNTKALQSLMYNLEKQNQKENQPKKIKIIKQNGDDNFDSSYELDSNEEEEDDFDDQRENAKISMESFRSDLKEADEFDQFNQFIHSIKQKQIQQKKQIKLPEYHRTNKARTSVKSNVITPKPSPLTSDSIRQGKRSTKENRVCWKKEMNFLMLF